MRSSIRAVVLASLMIMFVANPAAASWQFTTWGMTPAQVIAASSGKAMALSEEESKGLSSGNQIARAAMPYASGEFQFKAIFLFDTSDHLVAVNLDLERGTMSALRIALEQKYGVPLPSGNWHSAEDEIVFFPIGENHGFVLYRPLTNQNNKGL